jgi:hypothetical protein
MTNAETIIWYHKYYFYLCKFDQNHNSLTHHFVRIVFFCVCVVGKEKGVEPF